MTLPFWDFWCFSRLNYTKKRGVIVFFYEKYLKPLQIKHLNLLIFKID